MDIERLVRGYVDSALGPRYQETRYIPDPHLPVAMVDPSRPARGDWRAWKPVDSTVTDEALDRLEQAIRLRYPPSYRVLLKSKHFYELPAVGLYFARHVIGRWEETLLGLYESWEPESIIGVGLIPFGMEAFMNAGPVCFDTRTRLPGGDYPVVFRDDGWLGTDREIKPMFSSSLKMFEGLRFLAESDLRFLLSEEEYPPEVVQHTLRELQRFLSIDPEGAGGPARSYWAGFIAGGREV